MGSIMQDKSLTAVTQRGLKRPLDLAPSSMSAFLQSGEGGHGHQTLLMANKRACPPAARPCSLELEELYEVIDDDDDDDCTLEANIKKELLISEMVRSLEEVIGINYNAGEPSSSSSSSSSSPSPPPSSSSSQLNSSCNTRGEALNRRGATSTFVPSCNSEESSSSTPSCSSQLDSSDECSSTFAHLIHEQHDLNSHSDMCNLHGLHSDSAYHGLANAMDRVEIRQLLAEADYHQELFGTNQL